MGISYGEIIKLETMFNEQCDSNGVVWTDDEVRDEALSQFICDYENGVEEPQVLLCGYGYIYY